MKRHLALVPIVGIAVFLCVYFYAASVYPGGTHFHPETKGYSHINNYWCDLTDRVTYAGVSNPSRPIALWGMVALLSSLIFYWYFLPLLFAGEAKWKTRIIRGFGCASMAVGLLLPLAHDMVINLSFLLGVIAFATTLVGLLQSREFQIFTAALIAILFCLTNFIMWRTGFGLEIMPLVQKMAFLSGFIWIGITVRRYALLIR